MAQVRVGANLAELEATLHRYQATKIELETTMSSIANVASGLENLEQEAEVEKLAEALASCARTWQGVKNQITALKEAKALPQVAFHRAFSLLSVGFVAKEGFSLFAHSYSMKHSMSANGTRID